MQIYLSPGIIGIHGSRVNATEHYHHALQLFLAPNNPFFLKTRDGLLSSRAAVIAPNTPHQLTATDLVSFLLEPESELAGCLSDHWLSGNTIADLGYNIAKRACAAFQDLPMTRKSLETFLLSVTPIKCVQSNLDSRIEKVLEWIDARVSTGNCSNVTLQSALNITFLSKSRFLHLFSEQLGIPWRRYLLWRRLWVVFKYAAAGYSLTDCAHFAAFSDSAHFSRTFKSMFGTSPTAILKNSQFIQVS